jgi:type IV pilus assembly protein PilQ
MRRRVAAAALAALLSAVPMAARPGPLITIDVRDVDIGDVISLLAAQSSVNIVTDGSLKPERMTLHLHDVTFDNALRAIVDAHALAVRRQGSILIVGSTQSMNRRGDTVVLGLRHAKPDDVAREIGAALPEGTVIVADARTGSVVVAGDAPTLAKARTLVAQLDDARFGAGSLPQTRVYSLRFVRPADVVAKLKAMVTDGNFVADDEENAVLVTGSEELQTVAVAAIANIDRASPQVLFEVKVADVTPVNDSSDVGLEFGGLDLTGLPLAGATTYAFTNGTIPVNVRLNALITQGRASILATPKLVTLNNKEADLTIGETYPIVYSTSVFGGQNVQYVDIGVHLRLTPTIGTDGSVTAEMHPEYSELIGYTSTGYPIVANRKIDSTLRVHDNETIVLGGLMRDASTQTIEKVPWLSEIPILGKFFQDKATSHERDEIVFLITPHILYPGTPAPTK